MSYSYADLYKCAQREVALRDNVYAKRGWTAERIKELTMMAEIAAHFKALAEAGRPSEDAPAGSAQTSCPPA